MACCLQKKSYEEMERGLTVFFMKDTAEFGCEFGNRER
jgi:hypothetical protein